MESIKFYCDNKPQIGEVVQVIFTQRNDDHAIGHMTEYNCDIIMTYAQATKKKKIKSINKVVPLEKELSATLEDFDPKTNMGNVSRAYLDEEVERFDNNFRLNQKLYQGIHQICFKLEVDFSYMWKEKVYPFINSKYKEVTTKFNYDDKEMPTFFDIFVDNLDDFKSVLDNDKIFQELKVRFERMTVVTKVNKKRVGIISNGGVENVKTLFKQCFADDEFSSVQDKITISYATPDFTIETKLPEEMLNNFVNLIVKTSKDIGNMYVKVY